MKKIAVVILIMGFLIIGSACSSMLEKDYLVISEYETGNVGADISSENGINSYNNLRREINALVSSYEEHGELKFNNYDGDVSDDLSKACWEIKANTALGAYIIDYISYDINQIVSYYEADVYITYKRSQEQVNSIIKVSSNYALRDQLEKSLSNFEENVVLKMSTIINNDASELEAYIEELYYSNPLEYPVLPIIQINSYPETGVEKIFEITLDYGYETWALIDIKDELQRYVIMVNNRLESTSDEEKIVDLCTILSDECLYKPELNAGEEVKVGDKLISSTSYGALIRKTADSEGMAMAFLALCLESDIDCMVVRGRLDQAEHFWNIVKIDDEYYHVDTSLIKLNGLSNCVFLSDKDIQGQYWWDTEIYPACQGEMKYSEIDSRMLGENPGD